MRPHAFGSDHEMPYHPASDAMNSEQSRFAQLHEYDAA